MAGYPFKEIESKWHGYWDEKRIYCTNLDSSENKLYCLVMFSYPSAQKLHIGHWYNYGLTDSWARKKRMQGYNVFEPMGYDAFGLPAENYAVKMGAHPSITTNDSVNYIRGQLKTIGAMYDWSREVNTSSPDYYKWTQWLFLKLYERGLAYQKTAPVNWCPNCQTVLANEQVLAQGDCERCGAFVTKRDLKQWFFKITDYADRLIEGHDKIDWPSATIAKQRHWIGRSEGVNIKFPLAEDSGFIDTFTTRADTIFGVTHIVLAPELPIVKEITTPAQWKEVEDYIQRAKETSDIERTALNREKTGVFTGAHAKNPLSGDIVPIWIADYALASYGTGAVMAVPAHDQRDFEFVQKYGIPLKLVIQNPDNSLEASRLTEAYTENGKMVKSGEFDGLSSEEGIKAVAEKLERAGQGGPAVSYHLRDWLISRQRFWGAPIPIIYCANCGVIPVPFENLPVLLPGGDIDFKPKGKSPLAVVDEFMNTECPKCGIPAKRDPDTMDTFVCSSWYFLRYTSTEFEDKPFDSDRVNNWLPVDLYVGGADHSNGHLLYSRFITKVLYDEGLLDFDEPFLKLRHQGIITHKGAKMSKSKDNVVNPDDFIERYGSDVFRLYLMFMGDYEQGGDWSDEGIIGIERFVDRIWRLYNDLLPLPKTDESSPPEELNCILNYTTKFVSEDIDNLKFNTAISRLMELLNALYSYIGNTEYDKLNLRFLDRCLNIFARLVAPLAPHLGEELFHRLGGKLETVFNERWPEYDPQALIVSNIEIAVQINGRLRDTIIINRKANKEQALFTALESDKIKRYVESAEIVKTIFVPGKLLNIVVKQ